MSNDKLIETLISRINKLPTVGRKSATKIAYNLLKKDRTELKELIQALTDGLNHINLCKVCNNLTAGDVCSICSNKTRLETGKVIVVGDPLDISAIEELAVFEGIYYVIPSYINPLAGSLNSDSWLLPFIKFLNDYNIKEVTIALNTSAEGDATANILIHICERKNIDVYRFATGLPSGAIFSNLDVNTILQSYLNRVKE